MLDAILDIVAGKLEEARPKDVVWGFFAFSALVLSWTVFFTNKVLQRRHERRLRTRRIDNRRVRGIFFDFTNETLRAQPLPKFSLDDWDESLRNLIRDWNAQKRVSDIIVPDDQRDADALEDLIHTEASELLIQSISGIRAFLQEHQIISEDDGFKHVRFLAALARPPKDSITWFDSARLVIIPINSAKKIATIADDQTIPTRLSGPNRKTWFAVLRQMGLSYMKSQRKGASADEVVGVAVVDLAFHE